AIKVYICFYMRSSTIRIFIVLAIVSISGILLTQMFWFRKAFQYKQAEFNKQVEMSLREVVKGILDYHGNKQSNSHPVEQVNEQLFVVQLDAPTEVAVLEYYLKNEFIKYRIQEDYEFAVFDCASKKPILGGTEVISEAGNIQYLDPKYGFPANYYFTIYFPHHAGNLISEMGVWLFSSLAVLLVSLFFGYGLFVILKQKRYAEIQRDFINNMAHEIRTPLTTISLSVKSIMGFQSAHQSEEKEMKYLEIIARESERLKAQLDRVLSFAGDGNLILLKPEKIDLHQFIQIHFADWCKQDPDKICELICSLDAEQKLVLIDPFHFYQAILNLLDNAKKYCKQKPSIMISTRNIGKHLLELEIKDNGIGIAPAFQQKIFEQFYRIPTGNIHDVKGFGIGLSYVKKVMRAHKAELSMKSKIDEGTSFFVRMNVEQ
ncbi:MAG: sensor histidine kinase, partial [Bacteroidia bacterium]